MREVIPSQRDSRPPLAETDVATRAKSVRNPQSAMLPFDPIHSPLTGTNLIEASAGTGKTYTIVGLYLRMLIEQGLSVDQILVVTFTVPATEELRRRLRTGMRDAVAAFEAGHSDQPLLTQLVAGHDAAARADTAVRLRIELQNFDEAAVFTIHGFCQRMLHDQAFESRMLFDTELVTETDDIKQEIIDDFWRTRFYNAPPVLVDYVLTRRISPESFAAELAQHLANPFLDVIPTRPAPSYVDAADAFAVALAELRQTWPQVRGEVADILMTSDALKKNQYGADGISQWLVEMDRLTTTTSAFPEFFKQFEKLTVTGIAKGTKKNCPAPSHSFLKLCEVVKERRNTLAARLDDVMRALKVELFEFVRTELHHRKTERSLQSFDDLLLNMYRAVCSAGDNAMTRAVEGKFKAALIDEFQDTDPLQFAVFTRLFGGPDHSLFFIGDPKQAIYSFRGADIFAYLDAVRTADSRFTLDTNWRSETRLVSAVNTIFNDAVRPFVFDEILFPDVQAAGAADRSPLCIDGQAQTAPFQLWFCKAEDAKAITKDIAKKTIPESVAAEIARLLDGDILIGARKLMPEDIAVILRTNAQVQLMHKVLAKNSIPAVMHTSEDLFASDEIAELERIMVAVAEPNNEARVRAAMATKMIGVNGNAIDEIRHHESAWEAWMVKFRTYNETWCRQGFIQMLGAMIVQEQLYPNLLRMPQGERRVTNLRHAAEILHGAAVEHRLGMGGLLKWLAEQRSRDAGWIEEHELRLEKDDNAVRLVTIHKCKGLQYPVVFCPFSWWEFAARKDSVLFHEPTDVAAPADRPPQEGSESDADTGRGSNAPPSARDAAVGAGAAPSHPACPVRRLESGMPLRPAAGHVLTLDFGSADIEQHRRLAAREQLAESLRLLYVALTRAQHRCYLVWGRFNDAERSALAYLFHQPKDTVEPSPDAGERYKTAASTDLWNDVKAVAERSDGAIQLSEMPLADGPAFESAGRSADSLKHRRFTRIIPSTWRISSFSAMVSGKKRRLELPDRDETGPGVAATVGTETVPAADIAVGADMFSFPQGARPGILIHKIFEDLDFTAVMSEATQSLIKKALDESQYDVERWQPAIHRMVRNVCDAPLPSEHGRLKLANVRPQDCTSELEFYMPLQTMSRNRLHDIFARHRQEACYGDFPEKIDALTFGQLQGFMKGFVDLVFTRDDRFYIVDWKSNYLGAATTDYESPALARVMRESYYVLQYHIYTMAVHRYLRRRMPEDYDYDHCFGGVFYLFVRGIAPDANSGIFFDRPPFALIDELCRELLA